MTMFPILSRSWASEVRVVDTVAMFSRVWAQSRRSSSQSARPSFPGLSSRNSGGSSSRDNPNSNLEAEGTVSAHIARLQSHTRSPALPLPWCVQSWQVSTTPNGLLEVGKVKRSLLPQEMGGTPAPLAREQCWPVVSTNKDTKSHLSLPEPTEVQPALTLAISTCARRPHRGPGREE